MLEGPDARGPSSLRSVDAVAVSSLGCFSLSRASCARKHDRAHLHPKRLDRRPGID